MNGAKSSVEKNRPLCYQAVPHGRRDVTKVCIRIAVPRIFAS